MVATTKPHATSFSGQHCQYQKEKAKRHPGNNEVGQHVIKSTLIFFVISTIKPKRDRQKIIKEKELWRNLNLCIKNMHISQHIYL